MVWRRADANGRPDGDLGPAGSPGARGGEAVSLIGSHVAVAGGLVKTGLGEAITVGAEIIQVFAGNPRSWVPGAVDPCRRRSVPSSLRRSGDPGRGACTSSDQSLLTVGPGAEPIRGRSRGHHATGGGDRRHRGGRPCRVIGSQVPPSSGPR